MSALVNDVLAGVGVPAFPSRDAIDQHNAYERISASARGRRGRARREVLADLSAEELYAEYQRGASLRAVGERHGVSAERVRAVFAERGWPVRPRGGRRVGAGFDGASAVGRMREGL